MQIFAASFLAYFLLTQRQRDSFDRVFARTAVDNRRGVLASDDLGNLHNLDQMP